MKRKTIKWILIIVVVGSLIGASVLLYLFNMPHRNVQATSADYQTTAIALVQEYLANPAKANNKYLQEEGESKVLSITGVVTSISEDMNHQKVVLLAGIPSKSGVSCTFTAETNIHLTTINLNDKITVKGVIRSGAGYDEDLELYEDVIIEKCDLLK